MTLREARSRGTARLRGAGIESPGLDASLLLAGVLKIRKEQLIIRDSEDMPEPGAVEFSLFLDRRIAGECVAYILGQKEFRGLDFIVTPEVLVPRPDTEILVETALSVLENRAAEKSKVLDLCTGSGAAAIALKHERPALTVCASDISPGALEVARENARRLVPPQGGAAEGITFFQGDLFAAIPCSFDLITANPPYIPSAQIAGLAPEVRREPLLALDGGGDGLEIIRRIIREASPHLLPGGVLLMEADPRQMAGITLILKKKGYRNIQIYQDLSGRDRVIGGTVPG
jgi:release factor glutamine methyltransferase